MTCPLCPTLARRATCHLLAALCSLLAIGSSPAFAQPEGQSLSASFRKAAERVLPSVVAIRPGGIVARGYQGLGPGSESPMVVEPAPGMMGLRGIPSPIIRAGGGCGVVIDAAHGRILTTDQALAGASRALVVFTDGRQVETNRVVRDPRSELVLLEISPQSVRLKEAEWASSESLQLGDWVLAVGRPTGRSHAISAGIVSGRGPRIAPAGEEEAIWTDALTSAANAGGPLVDLTGKVVGINVTPRDPRSQADGFGLAIPIERARRFAGDLAEYGQVRRGYLGLSIGPDEVDPNRASSSSTGLVITGVTEGGAAADAGFRVGDRIMALDGQPTRELDALSKVVERSPIGQEFRITVERNGKTQDITVRSRPRPESPGNMPVRVAPGPRALVPRGRLRDPVRQAPAAVRPRGPVIQSEGPDDEMPPRAEPEVRREPARPAPTTQPRPSKPAPEPLTQPTSEPRPAPKPEPKPPASPAPKPAPGPKPEPAPRPETGPKPTPTPGPKPAPGPDADEVSPLPPALELPPPGAGDAGPAAVPKDASNPPKPDPKPRETPKSKAAPRPG